MNDSGKRISVAIIAGGANARFGGTPKGLEHVGGRRIIDRLIDAASRLSRHLMLVSNSDDAHRWVDGIPVVRDIRPERGSVVGLHTALSATGGRTLVLAWDMPFVTPALLNLIVERGEGEPFAVVPEGSAGLEPFCALYTQACLPIVASAIDAGDLRATSLPLRFPSYTRITGADVATVGDPKKLFFNVNSAADLARAEAIEREPRSRYRGASEYP